MAKGFCKDCGCARESGYENDTRCRACRSKINKLKRLQAREAQGKKPWGTGRSNFCSVCQNLKEPGRENESYCKTCKSEAGKRRRLKKRLEAGLRPLGSGRKPECYSCGSVKENPNSGYCFSCARKRDNEWRLRTGRTKAHRTGKCRCGNERAPYSNCYCSQCASQWRKKYLQDHPDEKAKVYKQANERRFKSFDEFIKYVARYTVNNAIKSGFLSKKGCEICNEIEVEAHHDDYTAPLEVRWLCKKHHAHHHATNESGD